jgi:hypothetical protein
MVVRAEILLPCPSSRRDFPHEAEERTDEMTTLQQIVLK